MKADGLEYEERMELLDEISYPQPLHELLAGAFEIYARANPWVSDWELEPKSVVREMIETGMTFSELVSRYSVTRSEGVVLRYLTDVLRSMRQVIPTDMRTSEVEDVLTWLGEVVRQVDSSLLSEWEALAGAASDAVDADGLTDAEVEAAERRFGDSETPPPFTANDRAFRTAVRGAAFRRVELLAREQYAALGALDGGAGWDPQRWADALGPYWSEYDDIGTDGAARSASLLIIEPEGRTWYVTQILADPDGDHDWRLILEIDLDACDAATEVVVRPLSLGQL